MLAGKKIVCQYVCQVVLVWEEYVCRVVFQLCVCVSWLHHFVGVYVDKCIGEKYH